MLIFRGIKRYSPESRYKHDLQTQTKYRSKKAERWHSTCVKESFQKRL